ncbi:hypothetical protein FAUST_8677 [Fusarium austroamericanum]|uniref:Fungal N-terminal domain-containing protein n=1 Tax=Fusarium austroamericanum TaxID=282268 RepID=A0AAN5Z4N8_FUSAU|nr:hypothetical protein FAUST_8677 [Fusarium austroamericanum]
MAELALAIIPIGIKVCTGFVNYLRELEDRGDTLNRLTRQAVSLEGSFLILDTFMKRGQLNPTRYEAVTQIGICLKNCEEGLQELTQFEQSQKAQNRLEHGIQKLCFPLRKAHLEQLQTTLDRLCKPLSLAVQNLQLEIDIANSNALAQHTTDIQQAASVVSRLHTAVTDLNAPISSVHSQIPLLQSSVDNFIPNIIPQINLVIESQLQGQMQEIRQSFQEKESAAIRRHETTNEMLSRLSTPYSNYNDMVQRLASKPSALAELASLTTACSCQGKGSSIAKTSCFGSLRLRDDVVVVDEETAPAFQIFGSLWRCQGFNYSRTYQDLCFKAVIQKLQDLFRSGRANPTDVNKDGMSLLHMLARAMNVWHSKNLDLELYSSLCLESLFDFLVATGTPISAVTSYGQLALDIAAAKFAVPASVLGKLCGADAVASTSSGWAKKDLSLERIVEYYRENLRVAEYLFRPLTLVIIRGNLKMAEQLISKYPECLDEISFYGKTPLYFAVEKPEMLKLIVDKASPAQLVQSNDPRDGYMTPLGRAMKISGKICKSQQTDDGSNCPCIVAAEMLLNADCPVIPDRDFVIGLWDENLFSSASKHCKVLVAQSLRTRRRELDKMARQRLLSFEYSSFSSSAGELDFYAVELDLLLRRKQRASFGCLSTIIPDETGYVGVERPIYNPIYLFLSSPEDASIFLDLGFLDIDPSQESNHTDEDYFDTTKCFLTYISPQENPHGLTLEKDERMWEEVETSKDDYEKAVYLNDFVTEFEDFMLDSSEDASTEEHSDELRKVDYRRALVFWNEIRPKRIREIKKSLAETWDPDLETLQDLGVTLWYEEEGEDDTASETSEDERARYFGKFLKDLENI